MQIMKHIFERRFAQSPKNVPGNRTGQLSSLYIKSTLNFMIRSSNLARKMSSKTVYTITKVGRKTANVVAESWGIDKAISSATCILCIIYS